MKSARRPRAHRGPGQLLGGALWGFAAVQVFDAVKLRRRNAAITRLSATIPLAAAGDDHDWVLFRTAESVGQEVRSRARVYAQDHDLDVVDLVPATLPADEMVSLLRRVDPDALRSTPLADLGGATRAVLAHRRATDRLVDAPGAEVDEVVLTPVQLASTTRELQLVAPFRADLVAVEGLAACTRSANEWWTLLDHRFGWTMPYGNATRVVAAAQGAHLAAIGVGLRRHPAAALAALAGWSLKPIIVGSTGDGHGLSSPAGPLDLLRRPVEVGRQWVEGRRAGRAACAITAAAEAEAATAYVSPSPDDLFEPRRETCPWCDAGPLVEHLRTTDLFQHKPGEFHLDRCTACGHIFQNPRLSVAGLDHYYADFYEGSGGDLMDRIFGAAEADCHKRIQFLLDADVAPTSWVDVGTGHGHFGLFARQQWPDARIDGLDLSTSVLEAGRRGWLDEAHHGLFPDLADQLANRYDGLSMHHYLEHTTHPDRELDAAAKVLGHGGLLQIEVPDPESHWERRLGRYWIPWFQPQHLNLVPYDNLIAALDERDFDIVQVERDINDPYQVLSAVALMIENVIPSGHLRWRPRGNGYHLARAVLMTAALPVYTGAIVSDLLAYALRDKAAPGVTYRVLARKR